MSTTRKRNVGSNQLPEKPCDEEMPQFKLDGLKRDAKNIALLITLYILQGVPLGLASAMPLLLQSGYKEGGMALVKVFSWVFWPFSLKLLWAPLVDSLYIARLGRRKCWLVPIQYLLGICLILVAINIDHWFARPDGKSWGPFGVSGTINIYAISGSFFGLNFLAATQDIVVDGWALTMLSKHNRGWASTCNTIGQVVGVIIGFPLFILLESPVYANRYFRRAPIPEQGFVSVKSYFLFWGLLFMVATTLVALFKKENTLLHERHVAQLKRSEGLGHVNPAFAAGENEFELRATENNTAVEVDEDQELDLSLSETYWIILRIARLKPVIRYSAVLLAFKIGVIALEAIMEPRLIDLGVSKEQITLLRFAVLPLHFILPILVSRWTNGPRPLSVISQCILPRLLIGLSGFLLVVFIQHFRVTTVDYTGPLQFGAPVPDNLRGSANADFQYLQNLQAHISSNDLRPLKYEYGVGLFLLLLLSTLAQNALSSPIFVAQMSFNAKISDPLVGGTYMTLLNTVANIASSMPTTLFLYLVDPLTKRACERVSDFDAGLSAMNLPASARKEAAGHVFSEIAKRHIEELGRDFLQLNATCKPMKGEEFCNFAGGSCVTYSDGFYVLYAVSNILAVILYFSFLRSSLRYLDSIPKTCYSFKSESLLTHEQESHRE